MVLTAYIFSWLVGLRWWQLSRGLIWQSFLSARLLLSLSAKCSHHYLGLVFPSSCWWWPRRFHCVAVQGTVLSLKGTVPDQLGGNRFNCKSIYCRDVLWHISESEGNATWLHRQLWQWQGISEVDRREGKPWGKQGLLKRLRTKYMPIMWPANMGAQCSHICPCN